MQKILQNQLAILKYFKFSNTNKTAITIKTKIKEDKYVSF